MRQLSVAMVCALLAGCGTIHHPPSEPTLQYNRDAGRTDAHNMLSSLVLPAGGTRSSTGPPPSLAHPGEGPPATPTALELHAWWRVKGTVSRVASFIEHHPPLEATKVGVGWLSGRTGVLSRTVTFSWPPVNGVLSQRSLVIEVVTLNSGYAGVRADAQVVWIQPKPAGERVPPAAQVLTVTRGLARQKPSLTFTTADAAEVQEAAGMLNRLPTVQPGGVNCPNIPVAPTVTFSFRATKNGPVLAQATMPSTGPNGECPGIAFSIQGKPQRSLSAQPSFLRSAGAVLGVTLLTK